MEEDGLNLEQQMCKCNDAIIFLAKYSLIGTRSPSEIGRVPALTRRMVALAYNLMKRTSSTALSGSFET
jgi:hypothetical protein